MIRRILACLSALAASGCIEVPPPPLPIAVAPPPAAAANASATSGQPECREFHQAIMIGGVAKEGYGTSCRQPDGSWRIENGRAPAGIRKEPPGPAPRY